MKRKRLVGGLIAAGLLMLAGSLRAAPPLADKVPADAIVYVGWAGADSLQGQYAASNIKGIIEASTVRDFISAQLPKLIQQAGTQDPNAPEIISRMQTALRVVWRHPVAFYIEPIDFSNFDQPVFHLGLLCDAGSDAQALGDMFRDALKRVPPNPQLSVAVAQEGSLVKLTLGGVTSASAMLATQPAFVAAMKQVPQDTSATALYIDVAKSVAMCEDAVKNAPNVPADAKQGIPVVFDALGLHGMTQIALQSGFDGKGWSDQSFIGYTGEKKGIMALAAGDPLTDASLAMIPKDAAAFSALRFDLHKAFQELRTIVGKTGSTSLTQFDQQVAAAGQAIGVDIEKDVLAPLGDEWVFYRAPLSDEGGMNFAVVHKLNDGEHFAKTLATLEDQVAKMAQGRFKIDKVTTNKIEVSSVSFLTYNVSWTVRNGYLYVSTLDGIAGAVKQVENKSPSITQSDLYKTAMASMPPGARPLSISYSNPAKLYPELRRTLLGLLPLARSAGVDIPADILPDSDDVAKFMTPGASIYWFDDTGLHSASHQAFPGAVGMGGNPGGPGMLALPALALGVTMPRMNQAQGAVQQVVDARNLTQIEMLCTIYSANHNAKMPDTLARLVADQATLTAAGAPQLDITKLLVRQGSGTSPLVMTPELQQLATSDFAKFSDQVAAHSDYVYLGEKISTSQANASQIIVAYTKPGPGLRGGINAAFLDGHVEFVTGPAIMFAFSQTNQIRDQNKLPPVDTQALMQQLGVNIIPAQPRRMLPQPGGAGPTGGMP